MSVNGEGADALPPPCGEGQPGEAGQGGAGAARDDRGLHHTAVRRARAARKTLTRQEARLWTWLRTLRSHGFHFRRQAPLMGYRADFACFSRKLIIEVDGGQHGCGEQAAHDAKRDFVLGRAGFRTVRFWNSDVDSNFDGVCDTIWRALNAPAPPWPAAQACPSPQGGGSKDADHV